MERYHDFKERQQREFDKFPIGAAFSDEQLAEMMQKFGLPNDESGYKQIIKVGAGCFIRKADKAAFLALCDKQDKERQEYISSDEGFLAALEYEFRNYECQISSDWEKGLLALGLTFGLLTEHQKELYRQAISNWYRKCVENDWF